MIHAIRARRKRSRADCWRDRDTWWWHCGSSDSHNNISRDWFSLLSEKGQNDMFCPVFTSDARSAHTRRECENALTPAFRRLPAERRAELLKSAS